MDVYYLQLINPSETVRFMTEINNPIMREICEQSNIKFSVSPIKSFGERLFINILNKRAVEL